MPKKLFHYSPHEDLEVIDPAHMGSSGRNYSPEYKGGISHLVPRSYYYTEDKPEPMMSKKGYHRHIAYMPDDFNVYDLHADPEEIVSHLRSTTSLKGNEFYDALEKEIHKRGYDAYHNSGSALPHALAVFKPLNVHKSNVHPFFDHDTQKSEALHAEVCPMLGSIIDGFEENMHHYKHLGPQSPEKYIRDWRHTHEVALESEYENAEKRFPDMSSIEARLYLAHLIAHKQKELMEHMGYEIDDIDFAKEYNSLLMSVASSSMSDMASCASLRGFSPSSKLADIKQVALFYMNNS